MFWPKILATVAATTVTTTMGVVTWLFFKTNDEQMPFGARKSLPYKTRGPFEKVEMGNVIYWRQASLKWMIARIKSLENLTLPAPPESYYHQKLWEDVKFFSKATTGNPWIVPVGYPIVFFLGFLGLYWGITRAFAKHAGNLVATVEKKMGGDKRPNGTNGFGSLGLSLTVPINAKPSDPPVPTPFLQSIPNNEHGSLCLDPVMSSDFDYVHFGTEPKVPFSPVQNTNPGHQIPSRIHDAPVEGFSNHQSTQNPSGDVTSLRDGVQVSWKGNSSRSEQVDNGLRKVVSDSTTKPVPAGSSPTQILKAQPFEAEQPIASQPPYVPPSASNSDTQAYHTTIGNNQEAGKISNNHTIHEHHASLPSFPQSTVAPTGQYHAAVDETQNSKPATYSPASTATIGASDPSSAAVIPHHTSKTEDHGDRLQRVTGIPQLHTEKLAEPSSKLPRPQPAAMLRHQPPRGPAASMKQTSPVAGKAMQYTAARVSGGNMTGSGFQVTQYGVLPHFGYPPYGHGSTHVPPRLSHNLQNPIGPTPSPGLRIWSIRSGSSGKPLSLPLPRFLEQVPAEYDPQAAIKRQYSGNIANESLTIKTAASKANGQVTPISQSLVNEVAGQIQGNKATNDPECLTNNNSSQAPPAKTPATETPAEVPSSSASPISAPKPSSKPLSEFSNLESQPPADKHADETPMKKSPSSIKTETPKGACSSSTPTTPAQPSSPSSAEAAEPDSKSSKDPHTNEAPRGRSCINVETLTPKKPSLPSTTTTPHQGSSSSTKLTSETPIADCQTPVDEPANEQPVDESLPKEETSKSTRDFTSSRLSDESEPTSSHTIQSNEDTMHAKKAPEDPKFKNTPSTTSLPSTPSPNAMNTPLLAVPKTDENRNEDAVNAQKVIENLKTGTLKIPPPSFPPLSLSQSSRMESRSVPMKPVEPKEDTESTGKASEDLRIGATPTASSSPSSSSPNDPTPLPADIVDTGKDTGSPREVSKDPESATIPTPAPPPPQSPSDKASSETNLPITTPSSQEENSKDPEYKTPTTPSSLPSSPTSKASNKEEPVFLTASSEKKVSPSLPPNTQGDVDLSSTVGCTDTSSAPCAPSTPSTPTSQVKPTPNLPTGSSSNSPSTMHNPRTTAVKPRGSATPESSSPAAKPSSKPSISLGETPKARSDSVPRPLSTSRSTGMLPIEETPISEVKPSPKPVGATPAVSPSVTQVSPGTPSSIEPPVTPRSSLFNDTPGSQPSLHSYRTDDDEPADSYSHVCYPPPTKGELHKIFDPKNRRRFPRPLRGDISEEESWFRVSIHKLRAEKSAQAKCDSPDYKRIWSSPGKSLDGKQALNPSPAEKISVEEQGSERAPDSKSTGSNASDAPKHGGKTHGNEGLNEAPPPNSTVSSSTDCSDRKPTPNASTAEEKPDELQHSVVASRGLTGPDTSDSPKKDAKSGNLQALTGIPSPKPDGSSPEASAKKTPTRRSVPQEKDDFVQIPPEGPSTTPATNSKPASIPIIRRNRFLPDSYDTTTNGDHAGQGSANWAKANITGGKLQAKKDSSIPVPVKADEPSDDPGAAARRLYERSSNDPAPPTEPKAMREVSGRRFFFLGPRPAQPGNAGKPTGFAGGEGGAEEGGRSTEPEKKGAGGGRDEGKGKGDQGGQLGGNGKKEGQGKGNQGGQSEGNGNKEGHGKAGQGGKAGDEWMNMKPPARGGKRRGTGRKR